MSYLYKRSNVLWHMLIRSRMTRAVWSPLVEWTRRRHLGFRERLDTMPILEGEERTLCLTLGALAELEARLMAGDLVGLSERFSSGRDISFPWITRQVCR